MAVSLKGFEPVVHKSTIHQFVDGKLHIVCAALTGQEDSLQLLEVADRLEKYLAVDSRTLTSFQLFSPPNTQIECEETGGNQLCDTFEPEAKRRHTASELSSIPPGQPSLGFSIPSGQPSQLTATLPDNLSSFPATASQHTLPPQTIVTFSSMF